MLESILFDYFAENANPDYATMCAWAKRYPEYADAIVEATVARATMDAMPDAPVDAAAEQRLVEYGRGVIAGLLNR